MSGVHLFMMEITVRDSRALITLEHVCKPYNKLYRSLHMWVLRHLAHTPKKTSADCIHGLKAGKARVQITRLVDVST